MASTSVPYVSCHMSVYLSVCVCTCVCVYMSLHIGLSVRLPVCVMHSYGIFICTDVCILWLG